VSVIEKIVAIPSNTRFSRGRAGSVACTDANDWALHQLVRARAQIGTNKTATLSGASLRAGRRRARAHKNSRTGQLARARAGVWWSLRP
jgi:hypothetical protein